MRLFRGLTRLLLLVIGCFQDGVESLALSPTTTRTATTTRNQNYPPKASVWSSLSLPFPSTDHLSRAQSRRPAVLSPFFASIGDETEGKLTPDNNNKDKFGFGQRIESLKCLVLGAIVGSFALAPLAFLGDVVLPLPYPTNPIAQWEFDNDMAGFQTGLFAIVYRYAIRQDGTTNPQLNQGVVAAFAVTRTLSRIVTPTYCTAITLNCGPPLGYFDWSMLGQLSINYIESAAMFAATAAAMDWAMNKGFISKFPG